MSEKKVVLITGVNGYWGGKVAEGLLTLKTKGNSASASENQFLHVIGLDTEPPRQEIKGLDFIQADIRNPLLINLLATEKVDTVCHLLFQEAQRPSEAAFSINVMSTMKILGACAEVGVRKVILRSSTGVYGADPSNPAFITEDHPLNGSRSNGSIRYQVEIEAFCNGFQKQVSDLALTILRFPSVIGPTIDTDMTRFLNQPLAPVLLGFDPLMQVIHESDAVDAIIFAIMNDFAGAFNVCADGILPLSKLMKIAGRIPLPVIHWLAYWSKPFLPGSACNVLAPIELDYLRYPWVADTTRMHQVMNFAPRYTAVEALREFSGLQRLRKYLPESAARAYDEERLRDTLERRRRIRERSGMEAVQEMEIIDE